MITDKMMARIRPNVTTREEAIAILGEPVMDRLTLDGQQVLIWKYWEAWDALAPSYHVRLSWNHWTANLKHQRSGTFRLVVDDKGMVVASYNDPSH